MTAVPIQHSYVPFVPFRQFHARTKRYAVMVCTRRAGKTVAVVNDMVVRALRTKKKGARYGYFAPNMKQGVRAAWDYFLEAVANIPGVVVKESSKTIDLPNGARIELYSAEDPHSIRGGKWDGAVLDEYGDMKSIMWTQVVRAGIADRQGWVVFIGTPRGKNHFYELRERARVSEQHRWFYLSVTAEDIIQNGGPEAGWGIWTREELDDVKLDTADEDEFLQEYMCSFDASNKGTYYGKHLQEIERRGQIRADDPRHPLLDPNEKVSIAMDIGFDDATSIWFWQAVDGEIRFIDYWEESGYDAEEVCELLELKPYAYETWWLPHDAKHHTFRSKKSVLDILREHNAPARIAPNPDAGNRIIHGVNAVRKTLRTYPLVFDEVRCARGLEALRNYSRRYDRDANVFSEKARHDQWSHGADAFRYACLSFNKSDIERSKERASRRRLTSAQQGTATGLGTLNRNEQSEVWTLNDAIKHSARMKARRASYGDPQL